MNYKPFTHGYYISLEVAMECQWALEVVPCAHSNGRTQLTTASLNPFTVELTYLYATDWEPDLPNLTYSPQDRAQHVGWG